MSALPFKLEYMGKLFKKISHKPTESYIIQRIWHRLDDDRVKFVLQQHVSFCYGYRALIDLYLPQFKIAVEVNEPYHLHNKQKQQDAIRNVEIERVAGCKVIVIDCSKELSEIHHQIDSVVTLIKKKIAERGSDFAPWCGNEEMCSKYYIDKGYFDVNENNYVQTIDEICEVFDTKAIHRGYLRAGAAVLPENDDYIIWFPSAFSKDWHNELLDDGLAIIEEKNGENKNKHIANALRAAEQGKIPKRITFFKEKDSLGFSFYKFVGVFEFDHERTKNNNSTYWKRILDRIDLEDFL